MEDRRVLIDFNKYKDTKDINKSIVQDLKDDSEQLDFEADFINRILSNPLYLDDLVRALDYNGIKFARITSEEEAQELLSKVKDELGFDDTYTFEAKTIEPDKIDKEVEEIIDKVDKSTDKMKGKINSFEDIANTVSVDRDDVNLNNVPDKYLDDYIKREGKIYITYFDGNSLVQYLATEETIGTLIGYTDTELKILLDKGKKDIFNKYMDIEYDLIMGVAENKQVPINLERINIICE